MKRFEIYMLILGLLVTLAFFGLLIALFLFEVKEANSSILYMSIGFIGGAFTTVISYFFGSSHGSKIKTEMMAKDKPGVYNYTITDESKG